MAESNFAACLDIVLVHEGGYVDHPRDPGGATMRGVTQGTLARWLGRPVSKAEVRALSVADVTPIYRRDYWDKVNGDLYAAGADLAVFDAGVNSGPGRANAWARQVAAKGNDAAVFVHAYCDVRMGFLKRLGTWSAFGRGWSRRVADIRAKGVVMARKSTGMPDAVVREQTRADGDRADARAGKDARAAVTTGAGGAAGGGGGLIVQQEIAGTALGLGGWAALCAVVVIVAGACAYLVTRSNNRMDEADALRREANHV